MHDMFFEIVVKDETFRKVGTWKFKKRDATKFFKILNSQYGLGMKIGDVKKHSSDLDWLK